MTTGIILDHAVDPGSPEWLRHMTASKIAAVVGLSRHDTPHSLWHKMAGTTPPEPQTRAQTRGHVFEPLIRGWLAELHPEWAVASTGTWQHATESWALAQPDGVVHVDGRLALLEIKTARDHWMWARDGVPVAYQAQVQWQMWVTGASRCLVASCGGDELIDMKPAETWIDADEGVQRWLAREGRLFLDSLDLGIAPAADYRRAEDRTALRWQHPTVVDDPGVEIPDEIAGAFLAAIGAHDVAESAKAVAAAELAAFLGDSKKATWRGVTLGTRRKGRGDGPPTFSTAPKLADKASDLLKGLEAA